MSGAARGTGLPSGWLAAHAGRSGTRRGREAVLGFRDGAAEVRALAEGAGLVPLLGRTWVRAAGADAAGYLQRMLTQDVASVGPGRGAAACVLSATGRVLGRLLLWHDEAGFALDLDASPVPAEAAPSGPPPALAALERYVIADDVVFHDASAAVVRALLLGPRAAEALAAAGLPAPAPGALAGAALPAPGGPVEAAVLAHPFGALTAYELRLGPAGADGAGDVLARLARAATPVGEPALDVLRVEQGVPWSGAEVDERILPNEARLEEALSWSKGCYPGQEPVVMAKHRGHPPTLLVRLQGDAGPLPAEGEALQVGGRPAGRLTTVVRGRDGRVGALGFVRHAWAAGGTLVTSASGPTLQVV